MPDVADVIGASPVRQLFARSRADVVVLERIARGGGETRWYLLQSDSQLDTLVRLLTPGSVVSFYFDGRIERVRYGPDVLKRILTIINMTGDAVVGLLGADGMTLEIESIAGPTDLAEFTATLGLDSTVFVGAFPARDNDGSAAVTVVLPDADGVVRAHPH